MIWPPVKAWTSLVPIEGKLHFIAINYGGKLLNKWVILMSVIDSNIVVKVPWLKLADSSKWKCGWDEINISGSSDLVNSENDIKITECAYPSNDSGLTIPIAKNNIRPWFENN